MKLEKKPTLHPNNKDAPFTRVERIKAFVLVLILPWIFWAPLLLSGAWLQTFPSFPRPWFGFWLTQFTISTAYMLSFFMLMDRPRILRERMSKFRPDKETSDLREKRFYAIGGPISLFGMLFVAWDACQQQDFPRFWNYIGSVMFLASFLAISLVFRVNAFASKIVYKQDDQKLITAGPYQMVRHPMYSAMIFFLIGFSLSVGSFVGILPMSVLVILLALRTFHEEEFLVQTFGDEYKAYCHQVKYRMIPLVF